MHQAGPNSQAGRDLLASLRPRKHYFVKNSVCKLSEDAKYVGMVEKDYHYHSMAWQLI